MTLSLHYTPGTKFLMTSSLKYIYVIIRFQKCPKYAVGDNNCQTADYCLLREFSFFKDCLFMIDKWHFNSHKGCSIASCASHYTADPELTDLNTSTSESGNKRLGVIRKSVRYMTEQHAMILLVTFMCMTNRYLILGRLG